METDCVQKVSQKWLKAREEYYHNNLEFRFCDSKILVTHEHFEECGGLSWERRGLNLDTGGQNQVLQTSREETGLSL